MRDADSTSTMFSGEDALNPDDSAEFSAELKQLAAKRLVSFEVKHDKTETHVTKIATE